RFAGARAQVNLKSDARLAVGAHLVARRHQRVAAENRIEHREAEPTQAAEALEYRAQGATGALGNLQCGGYALGLARDLDIGVAQRLARSLRAFQSAVRYDGDDVHGLLLPRHYTKVNVMERGHASQRYRLAPQLARSSSPSTNRRKRFDCDSRAPRV